jgi:hypothetical protein
VTGEGGIHRKPAYFVIQAGLRINALRQYNHLTPVTPFATLSAFPAAVLADYFLAKT